MLLVSEIGWLQCWRWIEHYRRIRWDFLEQQMSWVSLPRYSSVSESAMVEGSKNVTSQRYVQPNCCVISKLNQTTQKLSPIPRVYLCIFLVECHNYQRLYCNISQYLKVLWWKGTKMSHLNVSCSLIFFFYENKIKLYRSCRISIECIFAYFNGVP